MLILLGLLSLRGAGGCEFPPDARNLHGPKTQLAFRFSPIQPKLGELFQVEVWLCDATGEVDGVLVDADATMPAHGHGMNYQPPQVAIENGKGVLEGFLFHMPGLWRLRFVVQRGAKAEYLSYDYQLEP